jgi:hypothetical protein
MINNNNNNNNKGKANNKEPIVIQTLDDLLSYEFS